MTDSRADRRRRHPAGILLAGLLSCSCLVPVATGAQPLQLLRPAPRVENAPAPAAQPAQPSQPVPLGGTAGGDPAPAEPPAAAAPASGAPPDGSAGTALPMRPLDTSAIVVNTLDVIDPDAIGVLGEAEGGFPVGLWQGTDWALVSGLMPRLPARSPSPVLRGLASRLLLSRASVPAGKPAAASFVALRVDRLLAMGDLADALALLRLVPEQSRDETFARTEIEAMFYDNRISDACGRVSSVAGLYEDDYWKQALAFCLALGGDSPRAALIADLLRERATGIDPAFFTAVETLGGQKPPEKVSLKSPTGLLLAMMRAARIRLADDMDGVDRPMVLRGMALSPNASLEARLGAAEKAFAAGALSTDELIRLYLSISFTPEELTNPISQAEAEWGPRGRALLIRSASVQDVALAKAETLRRAWALGREKGGYAEIARASVPALETVAPSAELIWFALDAARVLFAGGRIEAALRWYEVIAADKDRVDEARSAEAALWPLAVLAGDGDAVPWTPERLDAWYAAQRKLQPELALRRALALYALLEATGRAVPPENWRGLLQGPVVSVEPGLNVAWTEGISRAAENGRIGEAVLLTAVGAAATGDEPFASVAAARQAISALRRLGLVAEARLLSIEIALAAGL